MARLNNRDDAAVRELARSLAVLEEGGAPALQTFVRELRAVLGAERAVAYAVGTADVGYELRFGHWAGFAQPARALNAMMATSLARLRGPWALYTPGAPERPQRNRVVVIPRAAALHARDITRLGLPAEQRERYAARMGRLEQSFLRRVGMADHHVCRALVCDGDRVLAWIGASQAAAFEPREQAMLRRLLPALQRRLRTERILGDGPLALAALPALLEAIPAAAFVLAKQGSVQYANTAGLAVLDRGLRENLVDAVRGRRGDIEISALGSHAFLAVLRMPVPHVDAARRRWNLTRRQVDVLERILRGDTNKEIAAGLGLGLRAVELHVTALFAKLRVPNRAALASRVLRG